MILMRRLVFNGGCKRPSARLRSVRYKGNVDRYPRKSFTIEFKLIQSER